MLNRLGWYIAGGLAALILALNAIQRLAQPDAPTVVLHVTSKQVLQGHPDTVLGPIRRITTTIVRADTIWRSEPTDTNSLLQAFCAPRVAIADTVHDTVRVKAELRLLLDAGRFDGDRLTLFGLDNAGSRYRGEFPHVHVPFEFTTVGDSVLVDQRRFHWPSWSGPLFFIVVGAAGDHFLLH